MLHHAARFMRQTSVVKSIPYRNLSLLYTNKDDEANRITALERLFLIKPAIKEEEEDEFYDGDMVDTPIELDGEPDPREKLAKNILKLGRVYYRHIEDRPEWFQQRKDEICSHRTAPQIRRCLKEWMIKSETVDIGKYYKKPLIFGDQVGLNQKVPTAMAFGPEETIAYAHYFMPSRYAITERIFKELKMLNPKFRPKRIVDFGCGPATGAAAAHSVWGDDISKYCGIDMSQSMIDAAKIMTRGLIKETQFFDKSSEVIRRAEQQGERFDLGILTYTLSDFVSDPSRRAAAQIMFELLDVGGHLVIIEPGNPKGSNMTRAARQLVLDIFNNTNAEGRSANQRTSTYLRPEEDAVDHSVDEDEEDYDKEVDQEALKAARHAAHKQKKVHVKTTALILPPPKGYRHDEVGASVVAPCTHDRPCPLGEGQWCSFSQKVYSGMIRKDSQEKFSYVVIQKRPRVESPEQKEQRLKALRELLPQEKKNEESFGTWTSGQIDTELLPVSEAMVTKVMDPSPLSVLKRFVGIEESSVQGVVDELIDEIDWEDYRPTLVREEFGRLLRSPLKMKGHVTMDLCHPSGTVLRNTVSKSNLLAVPSLYGALRKTTWGGLFPALLDDTEKSALALRAKGNPSGPGQDNILGDNFDEETTVEAPKSKKVDGANKKGKVKVLIPGSPAAKAFEEEMMRRQMNDFTGRPLMKKVFYPPVPEPNVRKMDERIMERYTKTMPQYLAGTRYEDERKEKEGQEEPRKGRVIRSSGIGARLNRIRGTRVKKGDVGDDDEV